jgi:hypothetical protein
MADDADCQHEPVIEHRVKKATSKQSNRVLDVLHDPWLWRIYENDFAPLDTIERLPSQGLWELSVDDRLDAEIVCKVISLLLQSLDKAGKRRAEVFDLTCGENMSPKAIAEKLNVSEPRISEDYAAIIQGGRIILEGYLQLKAAVGPEHEPVYELAMKGKSKEYIAEQLKKPEYCVNRSLRVIAKQWRKMYLKEIENSGQFKCPVQGGNGNE